jgi:hypothetical protein
MRDDHPPGPSGPGEALPPLPPLPALTRAEAELVDCYLDAVEQLGRVNPARVAHTYPALRAAQALVVRALALRDALVTMHQRGEQELHTETLARAMRLLEGERRSAQAAVPPARRTDGQPG